MTKVRQDSTRPKKVVLIIGENMMTFQQLSPILELAGENSKDILLIGNGKRLLTIEDLNYITQSAIDENTLFITIIHGQINMDSEHILVQSSGMKSTAINTLDFLESLQEKMNFKVMNYLVSCYSGTVLKESKNVIRMKNISLLTSGGKYNTIVANNMQYVSRAILQRVEQDKTPQKIFSMIILSNPETMHFNQDGKKIKLTIPGKFSLDEIEVILTRLEKKFFGQSVSNNYTKYTVGLFKKTGKEFFSINNINTMFYNKRHHEESFGRLIIKEFLCALRDKLSAEEIIGNRYEMYSRFNKFVGLKSEKKIEIDESQLITKTFLIFVSRGYLEEVKVLLENFPKLNLLNVHNNLALDLAVEKGHLHIVDFFVAQNNLDLQKAIKDGSRIENGPLFLAAQNNDTKMFNLLLQARSQVEDFRIILVPTTSFEVRKFFVNNQKEVQGVKLIDVGSTKNREFMVHSLLPVKKKENKFEDKKDKENRPYSQFPVGKKAEKLGLADIKKKLLAKKAKEDKNNSDKTPFIVVSPTVEGLSDKNKGDGGVEIE